MIVYIMFTGMFKLAFNHSEQEKPVQPLRNQDYSERN